MKDRDDVPVTAGDAESAPKKGAWFAHLDGGQGPSARATAIAVVVLTAFAALLRFPNLDRIKKLIFDETYYVKQAYSLWQVGHERKWPDKSDEKFTAGTPSSFLTDADFVVHPPVGKWMIAFGEMLFGIESVFGWRFSAAVCGCLMVAMITWVAVRLFRSLPLGVLAGLFLAIDGHHIVHSRTSLLDIFVAFWALAAFCCLIADRDASHRKLAKIMSAGGSPDAWLGLRPWRWAMGVSLGLMVGTKWSGLYLLAVFGLFTVFWDVALRRRAGSTRPWWRLVLTDGLVAFVKIVPTALVVYVSTWVGWFRSTDGYYRDWAVENGSGPLPHAIQSLWHYHVEAYKFHVGLSSPHDYQSNPWSWVWQWRPTAFYYTGAEISCGPTATKCSQAVLSLGNLIIWWGGAMAISVLAFHWLLRRDWRAGAIMAGLIGCYFPWFAYQGRTIYQFYAVAFEAFIVLGFVYALGLIWGSRDASPARRRTGLIIVGAITAAAVLMSAYFWPIIVGDPIPYTEWQARMWFSSWV